MHPSSSRVAAATSRKVASARSTVLLTGVLAVTSAIAFGARVEPDAPAAPAATSRPTTGPTSQPTEPAVKIEATDLEKLKANLGKRAEVSGTVFRAQLSRTGKVLRIEFKGAKEGGMQAVIFERNLRAFRAEFGEDLGAVLNGKKIAVVGILQDYQGKPEIILADIAQLKITP